MYATVSMILALFTGCKTDDANDTGSKDCSDGLPASTFDGDVGEADVASFCDGVCARDVTGSVVLDATSLTNLDGLSCLTAISGDLYIRSNADLTSITGLANLESVGGNLSIGEAYCGWDAYGGFSCGENYGNPALPSLDGLQSLRTIGGWLWIGDNDALTTGGSFDALTQIGGAHPDAQDGLLVNGNANLEYLPDFPQLTTITGQIEISVNDSLLSMDGLDALTTHEGWFDPYVSSGFFMIMFNPQLTSLDALANLQTIGGDFLVYNEQLTSYEGLHNVTTVGGYMDVWGTQLTSLAGLRSLTSVDGWLNLIDNDALTSFEGLESLDSIGSHPDCVDLGGCGLNIMDHEALVSVDGLESLTTIYGALQIMGYVEPGNPSLADLKGLYGLETVSGDVVIRGNASLADTEAQALVDEIESVGGTVTIEDNQ